MDLAFTPQEQAFREEVREWVKAYLPEALAHKVHHALRLTRDDMQSWAKILGRKGWLGYGWIKDISGDDLARELNKQFNAKQALNAHFGDPVEFLKKHFTVINVN